MGTMDQNPSKSQSKPKKAYNKSDIPRLSNGKDLPEDRGDLRTLINNYALDNPLLQKQFKDMDADLLKAAQRLEREGYELSGAVKAGEYLPEAWAEIEESKAYLEGWSRDIDMHYEERAASMDPVTRRNAVPEGRRGILLARPRKDLKIWSDNTQSSSVLATVTSGKMVEVDRIEGPWMRVAFSHKGCQRYGWVRTALFCDHPSMIRDYAYQDTPGDLSQTEQHAETETSTSNGKEQAGGSTPPDGKPGKNSEAGAA